MLTFAQVYGPEVVFHPRAPSGYHLLRRTNEANRDEYTCSFVSLTGGSPMVCPRASLTTEARDLLDGLGLPWIEQPVIYDHASEIPALDDFRCVRLASERVNGTSNSIICS